MLIVLYILLLRLGLAEPIPCTVLPEFYGNVYEVNLSGNRGEDGVVIKPDKGKLWDVSMEVLDVDEAEALLDSVPKIREVRDLARAALAPYKEHDPDMRKKGGSGTIGLTWSLQRNRRGVPKLTQLYFFQKKLGIVVSEDYAGSFRIEPVMDAFFAEDAEVYQLDLEVTQCPLTHKAEGVAWWSGVTYFGAAESHLIQQMPIARVPSYGLTIAQRAVIERLVEENPQHGLRWLLRADGGTEFEVGVSNLGKMTPEAAAPPAACQRRTSFTRQGRPPHDLGAASATAGPTGTGATYGKATQFTAGPNGYGAQVRYQSGEDHLSKTQAMEPWMLAKSHARNYFMLINLALHCAATDERPESWASRLLTRPKLALESLKTLEFRDSVRTGAPVEDLKIVGARVNPGRGGWERKYVFDVLREDGGVGEWASYDIAARFEVDRPADEAAVFTGEGHPGST
ncbi:unnamed protein product [Pelagomonas calceolata]|uniref:Amine oxidase n=1 Tax=Pelagomonas calceolata TaxID=35677 RepID=A0A8J2SMZ3_9STRA|nr:unnamed protein product [Pelagomonas calceolata]